MKTADRFEIEQWNTRTSPRGLGWRRRQSYSPNRTLPHQILLRAENHIRNFLDHDLHRPEFGFGQLWSSCDTPEHWNHPGYSHCTPLIDLRAVERPDQRFPDGRKMVHFAVSPVGNGPGWPTPGAEPLIKNFLDAFQSTVTSQKFSVVPNLLAHTSTRAQNSIANVI